MKKNEKNNKKRKDKLIPILSIITVLVFLLGFGYIMYIQNYSDAMNSTVQKSDYKKHYVMISENISSDFWQTVYKAAKEYGDKEGIYIEAVGANLPDDYTMADYLKISIASDVDGIIICPDGSDRVNSLIDKAVDYGIPVVTLLSDAADTKRVSFVGINTYQMGQVYAEQILNLVDKDTRKIYVLLEEEDAIANDVIFSQIKTELLSRIGRMLNIDVEPYYVKNDNPFDAEEAIRNIFVDKKSLPDMVVSLNETDSECAYQAAVDYNQVGNVKLIAYYSSDIILNAITKGIVSKSIELDTEQLGQYSIKALQDYQSSGYVSDYISVDLNVISRKNVDKYLE